MMNSSSESVKANNAPQDRRQQQRQHDQAQALDAFAPRSAAARSSERSKPCSLAATTSITNGVVYTA